MNRRMISYRIKQWLLESALATATRNNDLEQVRRIEALLQRLEVEDKP